MFSAALLCAARRIALVCAGLLFTASARPASAQSPQAAACTAAALDLTLRFSNYPAATWVVAVLARNVSPHACLLSGYDTPSFVTSDPHPAVPVQLCIGCDGTQRNAPSPPITLQPDETAHETYRWSTEPTPGAPPCQRARWLSSQSSSTHEHTLFFVVPALLPPICSQVDVEGFARGTVLDEDDLPSQAELPPLPPLRLTSPGKHLYAGEFLALQAESGVPPSGPAIGRGTRACPAFLLRQRAPDGYTRYDEMREPRIRCLADAGPPAQQQPHITTSFDSLAHLGALDPGDNIVQFLQIIGPAHAPRVALAESNRVTLRVIDPATAPRRWGALERGLRVDLTLDKFTFALGEDIPLHIAAEVLSAGSPLFDEPYLPRPQSYDASAGSFHLAITSTSGPQPGDDLPANLYRRVGPPEGPTACPDPLPVNAVLPLERSLKLYDLLPTIPGTYQLVVEWTPYRSRAASCDHASPNDSEPYATAISNPVVIRIAGGPYPVDEVNSLPQYTSWQSGFALTDTALGKHTGLLDHATHLEWLRLSETANKSQDTLGRMMAPKRPLDGWRFATRDEVIAMFTDFTGTADGRSQDPAVERKLQELLGGPLGTPKSTGGGWKRKITNGQIAGFETPPDFNRPAAAPRFRYHYAVISETEQDGQITALVDPHLTGWIDGDRTTPANGTFLVRPH